uniref:mannosyltransferase family protein n=1 Tax=Streptomyces sp. CRN 30 TaxID=3075613 RepID=UPI0039C03825
MTHAATRVSAPARTVVVERGGERPGRAGTGAFGAVVLFLAVRLAGAAAVAVAARAGGQDPLRLLGRSWDSRWYLGIAAHGYGRTLYWPDGTVQSDLAFFPLYPALIRVTTSVLPLTGTWAGLLVSWTAAAVAAWGIHAVALRLHGRAVARTLVVLWGLLPHSVVLSMAYTEPVLTACAAWALYAVLTGRWAAAGALAALAGAARPNGLAVVAAVLAAAA